MATMHETHFVTRTLKVTGMVCSGCAGIITDAVAGLDGIREVKPDWKRNSVTVTYDLYRVRAQEVEKILAEIGYPPDPGLFHRTKRDWLHFTEQNEVDNLKHVAHCCSKPPAGA